MSGDGSENEIDTDDELEAARKVMLLGFTHFLLIFLALVN